MDCTMTAPEWQLHVTSVLQNQSLCQGWICTRLLLYIQNTERSIQDIFNLLFHFDIHHSFVWVHTFGIKLKKTLSFCVCFSSDKLYPGCGPWIAGVFSWRSFFPPWENTAGVTLSQPHGKFGLDDLGLFDLTSPAAQGKVLQQIILNTESESNKRQHFGTLQGWWITPRLVRGLFFLTVALHRPIHCQTWWQIWAPTRWCRHLFPRTILVRRQVLVLVPVRTLRCSAPAMRATPVLRARTASWITCCPRRH